MLFVLGFVLFALGITVSVALHECGHMWAAQATGMKVRRYFVGFGPKIYSFRRGETEYGVKALPLGGFCEIAGMTALDELEPEEVDRAMYRQATWKRLIVMFAGIFMNFLLAFLLIAALAMTAGLPRLTEPSPTIGAVGCVPTQNADLSYGECSGAGPAQRAGLRPGDTVTAVDGVPVGTWSEFQTATQEKAGVLTYTVDRDGSELTVEVVPEQVDRYRDDGTSREISAVGVTLESQGPVTYGPIAAIPASAVFTADLAVRTAQSLVQLPQKVGALWEAVSGGERDADTPVSVYGASRLGGESFAAGMWGWFILLLASLNFFLGIFNLLPLLPLDGGHIAVVIFEKLRNTIRGFRGLPPGGPVDYLKLLPITYVAVVLGGAYMLLTLAADIVNPIRLL